MKLSIKAFGEMTGVSVRTLHYYDEIGLLKPDFLDRDSGYRYYGEEALSRMREILFYRELDFSLKAIGEILSSPDYDKKEALREQRKLLLLKRERLDRLIKALEDGEKGGSTMNFKVFDSSEITAYKDEVKARWGDTAAYKENEEKTADYTKEKWSAVAEGIDSIMADFAATKAEGKESDSDEARALAERLKSFITATQYTCTDDILLSLGEMYVSDERFKMNIDKKGEGTAEYIRDAIRAYCRK